MNKDICKTRKETFKFGVMQRLILEVSWYIVVTIADDDDTNTNHNVYFLLGDKDTWVWGVGLWVG